MEEKKLKFEYDKFGFLCAKSYSSAEHLHWHRLRRYRSLRGKNPSLTWQDFLVYEKDHPAKPCEECLKAISEKQSFKGGI